MLEWSQPHHLSRVIISSEQSMISTLLIFHIFHQYWISNFVLLPIQSQKSITIIMWMFATASKHNKLPVSTESKEEIRKRAKIANSIQSVLRFWASSQVKTFTWCVFDVSHWKWWRKSHPNGFNIGFLFEICWMSSDLNLCTYDSFDLMYKFITNKMCLYITIHTVW